MRRTTAWPPRSPDFNPLDFNLWEHLKTLVYAAPVDSEEALHHRIVDACQTIRDYFGIFERMRRSMMTRVEASIESHGGNFDHLL
jgi:transposase